LAFYLIETLNEKELELTLKVEEKMNDINKNEINLLNKKNEVIKEFLFFIFILLTIILILFDQD
jgi:hypothetical protein